MRYSTCPFRVTKIKNDNGKFCSCTPLLAKQNDTTTLEESQQLCIKLKFNSAFPFLDIYPREGKKKIICPHKDLYRNVKSFVTVGKTGKLKLPINWRVGKQIVQPLKWIGNKLMIHNDTDESQKLFAM